MQTDDTAQLVPASRDDLASALSFALRFDGRKVWRRADDLTAKIAAEHLVRYLDTAGFVVMRKAPARPPHI